MNQDETSYRKSFYLNYASTRSLWNERAIELAIYLKRRKPFLMQIIKRHFPENLNAKIIDVGCGEGALLSFAKDQGYQDLTGYDMSEEQVLLAKKMGLHQVYLGEAIPALCELADHSIDVIVSFDVIEHMTKPEVIRFSREVHRVLKLGGKWIIHTLNAESPFFGRIRYGDFTHENGFTKDSIKQLLRIADFHHVSCYEDVPVCHGFKSGLRFIIWKIVRSMYHLCLAAETGEKNGIFSQNFLAVAIKK